MCLAAQSPELREKLADILRQRHLLCESLSSSLEFITFVERFVTGSSGSTSPLTLEVVSEWSPVQRRIYLAEAFLNSKSRQ